MAGGQAYRDGRAAAGTVIRRSRLASAIPAALALAGCSLAPEPATLGFAVPRHYDAVGARTPAPVPDRWWTRFGSRELTAFVDGADASSLDLAAAAARVEQADAQARIAGSALFPILDLATDSSRSQSPGVGRGGSPTVRNSVSGILNASYEIDLFGRNRDLLRAAERGETASRYAREVVRLATQASLVNAYFELAAARERSRIASDNVGNAERILSVIRDRLNVGTGTALDLAQQESFVAQQRAAIPPLRQTADQARTAVALLLGRPPQALTVTAPVLSALRLPAIGAGIPSTLLVRRPDIREAEAQLAAADANVEAARKALLPTISLTGSAGYRSSALSSLFRPDAALWSIAGGLTQPIFEGGRLTAQVDLAEAQRQELIAFYRRSVVAGFTDVENALIAIRDSAARESALKVVVDKARQAFRLSEERLRQGTIDLVTLLNTQSTLSQAQDSLVQARLQRFQAVVTLIQALGGDWLSRVTIADDGSETARNTR